MRLFAILILMFSIVTPVLSVAYAAPKTEYAPLSDPFQNDAFVKSWVGIAMAETMTFGFHNYDERMEQNAPRFTKKGWDAFKTALERSRTPEMVRLHQQLVSASIAAAPTIKKKRVKDNVFEWIVSAPLVITYSNGKRTQSNKLLVTLVIHRSDETQNLDGIGITQWIATPV